MEAKLYFCFVLIVVCEDIPYDYILNGGLEDPPVSPSAFSAVCICPTYWSCSPAAEMMGPLSLSPSRMFNQYLNLDSGADQHISQSIKFNDSASCQLEN